MAVDFGGVKMKNPINTASGTFGQGWQFSELMDVSQLGAITTKGCAAEPWPGNPAPRMTEVRGGMMNSVGLQNPGVSAFAANYGPWLADLTDKGTQVICQVAGHSTEEYVRALEMFDELCPWAAGFEINVSCPNIAAGGAACGSTPEGAAEVMRACRKVCDRPLFVKMAPVRIPEIARALEAEGADGLTVINSIPGMAIDVHTRLQALQAHGRSFGPAVPPHRRSHGVGGRQRGRYPGLRRGRRHDGRGRGRVHPRRRVLRVGGHGELRRARRFRAHPARA